MNLRRPTLRLVSLAALVPSVLGLARITYASAPIGRYTVANGTVYDTKTKLTWQQTSPASSFTWGSSSSPVTAQYYCATLGLNGGGWRLPTVGELTSPVDYSAPAGLMIDATFLGMPAPTASFFWSTTPESGNGGMAWTVFFYNGQTEPRQVSNSAGTPNDYYARCVR
jgi:hypothetical protein